MNNMRSFRTVPYSALPLAVAVVLTACGGGGGGGAAKAIISEESLSETVGRISETTTYCAPDTSLSTAARVALESTKKIAAIVEATRLVSDTEGAIPRASFGYDVSGNCATNPGKFAYGYDHASGITRIEIDFQNYCVTGPQGNTYYDGTVKTREIGTPTDSGPRISALEMSTDGPVEVQAGGESTVAITITGGKTTYGTPSISDPAIPTTSAPDRTTISRVTAIETTATETRTHTLSNVTLKRTGTLENATIEVTAGQYRGPDGKVADVRTVAGDPARINVETGEFLGGAIILSGANNTEAVITPGSTARSVSVQINDGPVHNDAVDCAEAATPIATLLVENDLLGLLRLN